jgi:hypothetical protein
MRRSGPHGSERQTLAPTPTKLIIREKINQNQAVWAAWSGRKAEKIAKQLTARAIVAIFGDIGKWDGILEFKP